MAKPKSNATALATVEVVDRRTGEITELQSSVLSAGGSWTQTSLLLPEDTAYDDWRDVGAQLRSIAGGVMWWLGDWVRFGERKYGEKYAQEIDATGYDYQTIVNAANVAQKFSESNRRRLNVSWSHHAEVAGFKSTQEQDAWLDRAEAESWSRNELRSAIKREKFLEAQSDVARQATERSGVRAVVHNAEAETFLSGVDPNSVDLLLTDPPYSTDIADIDAFVDGWLPLALSRLKADARAYIFTGAYPNELAAYLRVLGAQGLDGRYQVLVWTYRNTLGPAPAHAYKLNWQACFYVWGPSAPPLNCPLMTEQFSVIDMSAPDGRQDSGRLHAWQKPDQLAEMLIRHASEPGARVVDPFAGTGTFLVMAAKLGRHSEGADVNPEQVELCVDRGCVRG